MAASSAAHITRLEEKLEDQRKAYEAKLEQGRVAHEADMAVVRHRADNIAACLDALLMLLEAAPNNAATHVSKIKDMRAKQEVAEAAEKAGIYAGKINTAKTP